MVCDFFYPRVGGVEMHLWSLSQCLIQRGHKVVVITHSYGSRKGVRYMTNGLKVYYLPLTPMVDENVLPTTFAWFPLFRNILVREGISIVHGHQATSSMMHEAVVQSRTMGYKTCYTDHSLFGFADAASINVNKMLKYTLSDIDHCICVSHTCRENLVLRASLDPHCVSAIPNAVDPSKFWPDPSARRPHDTVNIVLMSRLVYRKGIDLAVDVIPRIAEQFPNVHFIVGGDGPKRLLLDEMVEKHNLHQRVELLGSVPHAEVRDVLVRGHIFLNTSLTESFCIAILEAACCGLYVVSTKVGGIPEVLPPGMIGLARTNTVDGLVHALAEALENVHQVDPHHFHEQIRHMYDWADVASRVETVYERMVRLPRLTLLERFERYRTVGRFAGLAACLHMAVLYLIWRVLEHVDPAEDIERAIDFDYKVYVENQNELHQSDYSRNCATEQQQGTA